MKQSYQKLLIALVVVFLSLGILAFAKYLIGNSADSKEVLKEHETNSMVVNETEKSTETQPTEVPKETKGVSEQSTEPESETSTEDEYSLYGEDWNEFAKIIDENYFAGQIVLGDVDSTTGMYFPKKLYNDEFIHCRMQQFIGDYCPRFYGDANKVLDQASSLIKGLKTQGMTDQPKQFYTPTDNSQKHLDLSDVVKHEWVEIQGLTIIGFTDDTTVLCAYNYPDDSTLVLLDMSGYIYSPDETPSFYDFGNLIDITIDGTISKVKKVGDYNVLVAKP